MPPLARLVALAGAVLLSACSGATPTQAPSPTAAPTPSPTLAILDTLPAGTVLVDLGGETNGVTVCAGSIWVAIFVNGTQAIAQIDPATATVLGQVDGGINSACLDGEPWVATGTGIQHVDPKTRAVLGSVALAQAYYVGVGGGSVWAPSGEDVVRIDPATATIIATIPTGAGSDVTEVEGDENAIWATVKARNVVHRIDPARNTVVANILAGPYAHGILVQPDAIWISNAHNDNVTRIDPATDAAISVTGPGSGVGLAEGGGFVWGSSREGNLFRIDPATNVATKVAHVGGWPYGMSVFEDVLWVTDGLYVVYGIPLAGLIP